jgi:hypothetical protein
LDHITLHEIIAVCVWYIWWQRREKVKGESVSPPKNSAFAVKALTANFMAAKTKSAEKEIKWFKPLRSFLKLNIDASYHNDVSGPAGMVLQNNKGEVLGGMFCPLDNLLSVARTEVTTLLKGPKFPECLGCCSCYVESDSLEIIQACNGEI